MTFLHWTISCCVLHWERQLLLFQTFFFFLVFYVGLRPRDFGMIIGVIITQLMLGQLLLRLYGVAFDINGYKILNQNPRSSDNHNFCIFPQNILWVLGVGTFLRHIHWESVPLLWFLINFAFLWWWLIILVSTFHELQSPWHRHVQLKVS